MQPNVTPWYGKSQRPFSTAADFFPLRRHRQYMMERSLRELGMPMPIGRAALKLVMREMIARNRIADGFLYIQVTRGAVKRDHIPPAEPPRPTLILTMRRQDLPGLNERLEKGVAVSTQPDIRWGRCDIKTVQLLPNLLAKQAARNAGAFEAWLVDNDGYITEGASTNAWIVTNDGLVITRPLSNAILPGVTRRVILEAIAQAHLKLAERKFTVAEAFSRQGGVPDLGDRSCGSGGRHRWSHYWNRGSRRVNRPYS